jgi:hypothetical protein
MSVIGLKVDTQDTKVLYIHTTNVTTFTTKNILPLLWENKLAARFVTSRTKRKEDTLTKGVCGTCYVKVIW